MEITYDIDFQYKPRNCKKPDPDRSAMLISGGETSALLIPSVGDFIEIDGPPGGLEPLSSFSGIVVSRLFRYERQTDKSVFCHVNIVVEESSLDFGRLVQE